jgi:hypothetical protein
LHQSSSPTTLFRLSHIDYRMSGRHRLAIQKFGTVVDLVSDWTCPTTTGSPDRRLTDQGCICVLETQTMDGIGAREIRCPGMWLFGLLEIWNLESIDEDRLRGGLHWALC